MEETYRDIEQEIRETEPNWQALALQELKPSNQGKRLFWREALDEAKAVKGLHLTEASEIGQAFEPFNKISNNSLLRPDIYGAMGEIPFEEIKSVGDGKLRVKSSAYEFSATPASMVFFPMGYASWNTCIVLHFIETPDIWKVQYPHSDWIIIMTNQHAFFRWGLVKPSGLLYAKSCAKTLQIFSEMANKIDGYKGDTAPVAS